MNLITLNIVLLALLFVNQLFGQTKIDLDQYNCFTFNIKYLKEGADTEALLLFITHNDIENPINKYTTAYLLEKRGLNTQLISDSGSLTSVCDIKISDKYNYLAINIVGEGHPWIEIYDLQTLIKDRNLVLLAEIQPYPGNVSMVGWQNEKLIIESDINLILKNDNKELTENAIFEDHKNFIFDIVSKKYQFK